jgi:hypothetical protein
MPAFEKATAKYDTLRAKIEPVEAEGNPGELRFVLMVSWRLHQGEADGELSQITLIFSSSAKVLLGGVVPMAVAMVATSLGLNRGGKFVSRTEFRDSPIGCPHRRISDRANVRSNLTAQLATASKVQGRTTSRCLSRPNMMASTGTSRSLKATTRATAASTCNSDGFTAFIDGAATERSKNPSDA